jgi:UDP-3-O-[3-hydroxymyristoyl] glucosamine N-acyltransferase
LNVNSLEAVQDGELTYAEDALRLVQALDSKASAIIVPLQAANLNGHSGIRVANPKLAFARVLTLFHPAAAPRHGIHPTAVLDESVQLDGDVDIRAHAVLEERVRIGRGTVIHAGAYIGEDVVIGRDCAIGPNVVIYAGSLLGDRVIIHGNTTIGGDGFGYVFDQGRHCKIPQVGNVVIENDVEIGCNVCVDRATIGSTRIREGAKIDNLVQIAHNNDIGRHAILTGQCGLSGSVTVGDYAVFGGRTAVTDHVAIGAGGRTGLASVITKNVAAGDTVLGYPARPIRQARQQMAALGRLPDALRRLLQTITRLMALEARVDALETDRRPPASL